MISRILAIAAAGAILAVWWIGFWTVLDWVLPEQAPDPAPKLIQEPLRRCGKEKNGYDRCEVGYNVDTKDIHLSLPQNESHAASAATT